MTYLYRIVSDLVCRWDYLKSFTCDIAINARALHHLATLPALRKMDLRGGCDDNIQSSMAGNRHPIASSAIVELTFNYLTWTTLLDNMAFTQLKSIQVFDVAPGETAATLERFLCVLHARCSHSSLHYVCIGQRHAAALNLLNDKHAEMFTVISTTGAPGDYYSAFL